MSFRKLRRRKDFRSKLRDYRASRFSQGSGYGYDYPERGINSTIRKFMATLPQRMLIAAVIVFVFSLMLRFDLPWSEKVINTANIFFSSDGELRDLTSWEDKLSPVWSRIVNGNDAEQVFAPGSTMRFPVDGGTAESFFGEVRPGLTGEQEMNYGIDFRASEGTAVKSAAAGCISQTGYNVRFGNFVIIDHGQEISTLYCFLQEASQQTGTKVDSGEALGKLGSEGILHFEIRDQGQPVDPLTYLPEGLQ